ncbi:large subunit ribosomal protein LP0 [Nematocida homosporus]|uniref:large subunit ribosomal protein LP0 n=1 Tax=Nematocida homosporus TaxID=1912981 RepID=UPI00221FB31A|nr:large subunit ribosomal protein LP0 [Nematocida homosporus]KAI5185520.1 large subunit ribosomal protein LP0 [Nematocida homosporus]
MIQIEQRTATPKLARKINSFNRTQEYFGKYSKFLVVDMTSMSSNQIQLIRHDILGKGDFLMGKNTTIKLALRKFAENRPELAGIESVIKNNVGVIFTNGSLSELEDIFEARKVNSVAKPGDLSQCDLWIEPVFTGLDPGKTSFFHALGIVTKITKGKIEILSRCQALYNGKRVGHSEAALLSLLGITPFVYKMKALHAYSNGKFFDVAHLALTSEAVEAMIQTSVDALSVMAIGAGYVTESTVEQEIAHTVRELMALAAAAEFAI